MLKQSAQLLKIAHQFNPGQIRIQTAIVIGLELVSVALLYVLNNIYGELYQAIQIYDTKMIWLSIGRFTGIAMVLVVINGYLGWFINKLAFSIRSGLTDFAILNSDKYAGQQLFNQRVQEDFKKFAESSVDLYTAIFKAVIKLPVFLAVIISLTEWYIGLSLFAAVVIGTWLTRVISRKLIILQSLQETNEAVFRQGLFAQNYLRIIEQFQLINKEFKKLAFMQSGLGQIFVLLPFILLMPLYVSKVITMGVFFQSVNALGKVIDSLSILIDSRQTIVSIETCLIRLRFLTRTEQD